MKNNAIVCLLIYFIVCISLQDVQGQSTMGYKICRSATNFEIGFGPTFLSNSNVSQNLGLGLNIGLGFRINLPTKYVFGNLYGNFKDFKADVSNNIEIKQNLQIFNVGAKINCYLYQSKNRLKSLYAFIDLSRSWTNLNYEYTVPAPMPLMDDDTEFISVFFGKFYSPGFGLKYYYHIIYLEVGYYFAHTKVKFEKDADSKLNEIGINYKHESNMKMNTLGIKIGLNVPFIGKYKQVTLENN
jgi:hypothetical protein